MKRALISALTVMMISAPLAAEQPGVPMSPGQAFLKQFDADNNGKVSKEEFLKPQVAHLEAQFAHIDSNKDGNATPEEAEAFIQQIRQRMMQMQQQAPQQ